MFLPSRTVQAERLFASNAVFLRSLRTNALTFVVGTLASGWDNVATKTRLVAWLAMIMTWLIAVPTASTLLANSSPPIPMTSRRVQLLTLLTPHAHRKCGLARKTLRFDIRRHAEPELATFKIVPSSALRSTHQSTFGASSRTSVARYSHPRTRRRLV